MNNLYLYRFLYHYFMVIHFYYDLIIIDDPSLHEELYKYGNLIYDQDEKGAFIFDPNIYLNKFLYASYKKLHKNIRAKIFGVNFTKDNDIEISEKVKDILMQNSNNDALIVLKDNDKKLLLGKKFMLFKYLDGLLCSGAVYKLDIYYDSNIYKLCYEEQFICNVYDKYDVNLIGNCYKPIYYGHSFSEWRYRFLLDSFDPKLMDHLLTVHERNIVEGWRNKRKDAQDSHSEKVEKYDRREFSLFHYDGDRRKF